MTGVGLGVVAVMLAGPPGPLVIEDPDGLLARLGAPVAVVTEYDEPTFGLSNQRRLRVLELRDGRQTGEPILAQIERLGDERMSIAWLLPPGPAGTRTFAVMSAREEAPAPSIERQPDGQYLLQDGELPVLRYVRTTIEPGALLDQITEPNRIYAVPRSDYLHPLYGPHGEELTLDWPVDHPHHRGIYWAWPETMYGDQMGDLHALQRVFARPVGELMRQIGPVYGQIRAESRWMWEDREPIVAEEVTIRAWRAGPAGRLIDLTIRLRALADGVTIARRGTNAYGGLNLRLAPVRDQVITLHTDPPEATPRAAWADLAGTFAGADEPCGLGILQHPANPDYPGDWVEFPALNWFQPTFPAANTRYPLARDRELMLRYRLWIRGAGPADPAAYADQWRAFVAGVKPDA